MANLESIDSSTLPPVMVPSEPLSPHRLFEQTEMKDRVRAALAMLPERERRIITLYYFEEATMKQIGSAIGVNESRVSQLHARAITRLKQALESGTISRSTRVAPRKPRQTTRRIAAKHTHVAARRRLRQVA
jgi:RNA polymerase sigma factor for flagellar operon FliA